MSAATEQSAKPRSDLRTWLAAVWIATIIAAILLLPPVLQLVLQVAWAFAFGQLRARRLVWGTVTVGVLLLAFYVVAGRLP